MGTDSSGLPWCEPGTHDHGVPGFSFQLPEVSDLASFSMLLSAFGGPGRRKGKSIPYLLSAFSVARAGERGKAFRTTT